MEYPMVVGFGQEFVPFGVHLVGFAVSRRGVRRCNLLYHKHDV